MLAIGIRYLCGWAMATHTADRSQPEWPPHPDRVFMALAAAHFETGEDTPEREALEWLANLHPPVMAVSDAHSREAVTSYVPVNDLAIGRPDKDSTEKLAKRLRAIAAIEKSDKLKDAGLAILPEYRWRQPRQFPVAIPDDPFVYLMWPGEKPSDECRRALEGLCGKVASLGHSSSLVQMWIEKHPPRPNLVTQESSGRYRLRVTGPGRLRALKDRFEAGLRPTSSLWCAYDAPIQAQAPSVGVGPYFQQNFIVLRRVTGPSFGLETTFQLTKALRDTMMKEYSDSHGGEQPPEWISGHQQNGEPSQKPHVAFFPLPHVGSEHADGHLLGFGIALPQSDSTEDLAHLWQGMLYDEGGLDRRWKLCMGRIGAWEVESESRFDPPRALQTETWAAAARRWATVTPIVLDRHPKGPLISREIEDTIATACEHIGLPPPAEVIASQVSMFAGVPHSGTFPMMQRKAGGKLNHTHAIILFKQPVRGPILLGAGRFRGYGLCRPILDGSGL